MKKTYTINLGGKIFHIDDDALDQLQNYIDTLKTHYSKEEGGDEIMSDIEHRVGELFTEKLKEKYREVVILEDVNEAIRTMGTPDDIFDEEAETETTSPRQPRKLYRDTDEQVIGGVAAGVAAYWGVSKLPVRICFVVLTLWYGVFSLVYLILWLAVPKAKTAKQKLEMKGESINVSNIERSIKEEYQEIKNGKFATFTRQCERGVSDVLKIVGQIIKIAVGICLLAGSVVTLLVFLSLLFLPHLFPWGENFAGLAYAFTETNLTIAKIALMVLGVTPILLTIFVAIKLLFNFRSNNKLILLSALAVWLIGLSTLIFVGVREGKSWTPQITSHDESCHLKARKTLVIDINERYSPVVSPAHNGIYRHEKGDEVELLQRPKLVISPSNDSLGRLSVNYRSFKKKRIYQDTDFNWTLHGDTLSFDNFFKLEGVWRGEESTVYLRVPEEMQLQFTPRAAAYLKKHNQLEWQIRSQLDQERFLFVMRDRGLHPVM